MKLKIKKAFKHITDYFHALLGFIAAVHMLFPYGWTGTLTILLAFIVYESMQKEKSITTTQDLVEFIVGWLFGMIAWRF